MLFYLGSLATSLSLTAAGSTHPCASTEAAVTVWRETDIVQEAGNDGQSEGAETHCVCMVWRRMRGLRATFGGRTAAGGAPAEIWRHGNRYAILLLSSDGEHHKGVTGVNYDRKKKKSGRWQKDH